jgi:drug/metabolite transporter (DMT)-like permease
MSFGSTLAIACAFTWSLSVILFKKAGDDLHPVFLNLMKNGLGFFLMVPTAYVASGALPPDLATGDVAILVVSGLLGIGIADALVLKSLKLVGATRMAIVECTYSPFIIALSLLFLGESMSTARLVGTALVLAAILCVSLKREPRAPDRTAFGMLVGVLGIFSMAAGVVLFKPIIGRVPLMWLIAIRLGAGFVASVVLAAALCDRRREWAALRATSRKDILLFACVLSTYVSMIMWVAGYRYNDAVITAVLNQTSTVFTVALATVFLRERFTPLKAAGTALAFGGVLLMTLI